MQNDRLSIIFYDAVNRFVRNIRSFVFIKDIVDNAIIAVVNIWIFPVDVIFVDSRNVTGNEGK